MELLGTGGKGEVSNHCCLCPRLLGSIVPIVFCSFGSSPLSQPNPRLASPVTRPSPAFWPLWQGRETLPLTVQLSSSVRLFWTSCYQLQRWFEWGVQDKHPGGMLLCGLGVLWDWRNKRSSHPAAVHRPLKKGMLGHTCAHGSRGSHLPQLLPPLVAFLVNIYLTHGGVH